MSRTVHGIAIALSVGACVTSPQDDGTAPPTPPKLDGYASGNSGDCSGSDSPQPMCVVSGAPGDIEASSMLAPTTVASVLVANGDGELAMTGGTGVTRLDTALNVRFTYPYGSVAALDRAGNAFVAGAFTTPTDFGTGTLTPSGNVDLFLAELSPTGEVLYATALGLCGDGLYDIEVAPDHRLAISGDAIGTVVLDDHGVLLFQVAAAGKLAFDSHGDLVIGGSTITNGNRDAFVTKVDAAGNERWRLALGDTALPVTFAGETITTPQPQAIADVAVGPNNEIAVLGAFRREMDLFGQPLYLPADFPSGPWAGSFLLRLAPDGSVITAGANAAFNAGNGPGGLAMSSPFSTDGVALKPGTGVAFSATGVLAVSINTAGNAQPPFSYPQLTVLDAADNLAYSVGNGTGTSGYGLGVAADACGNIYWADRENTPNIFDSHVFLTKRAP